MRLLHHLPTLAALAALSVSADQGGAPDPAASAPGPGEGVAPEPGSGDDLHPMAARVAELEKDRDDILAASETAIGELKEQLAAAADARDAALADAAALAGKLKKAEAKLAAAKSPARSVEPSDEQLDLATADPRALAGEHYVVMATSQVSDAAGALIARGRVATGKPARLAALVAEGKARPARVFECEAAQARAGIAVVAD